MPSSDGLFLIPWPASVIELFQATNASQTLFAQSSAAVAELSVPLAPEELSLPPPQPAATIAAERIRTARSERMPGMLAANRHVDADNVPILERPHLHEVAQLVREPEPSPARFLENRLAPAGERRIESARVLDLEKEGATVVPGANDSEASAVADAVRRDLVHGEDERVRRLAVESGGLGSFGDELPDVAERVGVEREPSRGRRRIFERICKGRRDRFEPAVLPLSRKDSTSDMKGCVRSASSTTLGSRADTSYGQRSQNAEVSANARLRSSSWRWHSASSESLRSAQIGSPIPRIARPPAPCSSTNSCQAAMMRAGFAPTSAMSAKSARSASSPSASRSRVIFSAARTTETGSPASIPSRMNWSAPRRNSSGPL